MLQLFTKPKLFTPCNKDLKYLASQLTDGTGISVESITQLPDNNIHIQLTFESTFGFFVPPGLRISLGVTNEVLLLCTKVKSCITNDIPAKFAVSFEKGNRRRKVTCSAPTGETYKMTCRKVFIESVERYCISEDGIKTPLSEMLDNYKDSGPKLRAWLTELKQQRDAERHQAK